MVVGTTARLTYRASASTVVLTGKRSTPHCASAAAAANAIVMAKNSTRQGISRPLSSIGVTRLLFCLPLADWRIRGSGSGRHVLPDPGIS
jgi:hypothetical protein